MATQGKRRKNGYLKPAFREIFICSKKELAPYGTVFAVSADNFESEKLGTLFGILKISDFSADSSYIVNLLTSVMKKEYFSKPERPSDESFEASLRKANLALAEMARHGSTGWTGKIDFTGGAVSRNNLHFSRLGNASVFLIRSGQIAEISHDLEKEKTSEPHPMKTFTDISSGKLEKGDKLIFTTSDLLEIFSPDELRHNATRFSQEEFSGLIEASLHANIEIGGTIVVDMVDREETGKYAKKPIIHPQAAFESEEAKPEERIAPDQAEPLPRDMGPTMSEILAPSEKKRREHLYIKEEREKEASKASTWGKAANLLKNSFQSLKSIVQKIFHKIAQLYHKAKIREKMFFLFRGKARPGHFVEKIRNRTGYFSGHISQLDPKKKKNYLWTAVSAVLLFSVGLYVYKNIVAKPAPEPESQSIVQAEPVAPSSPEDANVKDISGLEQVASLSQTAAGASLLGNTIFAIPESGKTIFKIDLDSKNVEEIPSSLDSGNFKLMAEMPHLNTIFILTEDKKVLSFTPINNNFQENGIGIPADLSAAGMKTYLTYLYFLDPPANQVYRYPRAEGGFGDRQDWLRSGADIKNAIDFSINDDLYAVSEKEITPYLQGRKDANINFEKPQTSLAIDSIFSEPDMEFIYILDSKNHRVVQYSKDGKIVAQFWNADISGVKNLVVDEKNKSVYLIKGNELLKFSME